MRNWIFILAVTLGSSGAVLGQGPAAELTTIDGTIKTLYGVISGAAGVERDWDLFAELFWPDARLNALGRDPEGKPRLMVMTVNDYVTRIGPNLTTRGFFEKEIGRVTEQYGDMTHLFSAYQSQSVADGPIIARGINSIQLVFREGRYWIVNILWESESPSNPIPKRYLKQKKGKLFGNEK
ncbi:MAG: hypothetical protein H6555_08050 [Lewinellaceae bacterium]|nr:hypothetical protein [Lewinellaceae bacterium]